MLRQSKVFLVNRPPSAAPVSAICKNILDLTYRCLEAIFLFIAQEHQECCRSLLQQSL